MPFLCSKILTPRGIRHGWVSFFELQIQIYRRNLDQNRKYFNPLVREPEVDSYDEKTWSTKISLGCPFKAQTNSVTSVQFSLLGANEWLCSELLREGAGAGPEGEGGRGELRQVQVAPPLLQVLRGFQIFRQVSRTFFITRQLLLVNIIRNKITFVHLFMTVSVNVSIALFKKKKKYDWVKVPLYWT